MSYDRNSLVMSREDALNIYVERKLVEQKLSHLLENIRHRKLHEANSQAEIKRALQEMRRLERLVILEAISDKDFNTMQKTFRSMLRAASLLIQRLSGSNLADKLNELRTDGVEALSELVSYIDDLESGENEEDSDDIRSKLGLAKTGSRIAGGLTKVRDKFVKTFTDFAVIFRGCMVLAEQFLESEHGPIARLLDKAEDASYEGDSLRQAFAILDSNSEKLYGDEDADGDKKGIFGRLMKNFVGQNKSTSTIAQFKNQLKRILAVTPGFAKAINIDQLADYLLDVPVDRIRAPFVMFDDAVTNSVNVDYLLQITKNPRGFTSTLKGLWNALDGSGSGGLNPRFA